jgi:hypothetical protein
MKKALLLATILSGLYAVSCNDPDKVSLNLDELLKCWTSSYEESAGVDGNLFRPCDFMEFPATHFRSRFTLFENNEATYLELSPVDAHEIVPGTWNYDDDAKVLTIKNTSGQTVYNYKVIKLESEKLILKPN